MRFSADEDVLKIRSAKHLADESLRVAIWDDRRVLFKLIDLTNVAVLTHNRLTNTLNIYIVNGKSGKVIY